MVHKELLGWGAGEERNTSRLKFPNISLGCLVEITLHCHFPFPVCGDECTGLLLGDLARLEQAVMTVNLTGPLPAPYKMLYSIENTTQELKVGCCG